MFSVDQFVIATLSRDGPTGAVIDPPAGALLSADGAGGASWDAPAPADLTLYVSLTGSDSNNGATPATALRTIEAAMVSVRRQGWTASASIRLLPGTHDLIGGGIFRTDVAPGPRESLLVVEGDSLASLGTFAVLSTAAPGILTEVTLTAAVPLAADGEHVRFTSGALNGQSFIVGNVSGSTFTLMGAGVFATPAPGDTLVLEAATAAINITDSITFTGGPFLLRNLQLVLPPSLFLLNNTLILSGVLVTSALSGGHIALVSSTLASGRGLLASIPGVGPNPMGFSVVGPGIGIQCQLSGSMTTQSSYFRDVTFIISNSTVDTNQDLYQGCLVYVVNESQWRCSECRYLDATPFPAALTLLDASSALTNVDISNTVGPGIALESSSLYLSGVISSVVPNTDTGIRISGQGRVAGQIGFLTPTITGIANPDVIIGHNAPATWANLISGAAPRSDFAALIPIFASIALI
jgi:hypothetical protein